MGSEPNGELTTNSADRGGGVGETHVLKARVGIVGVAAGGVHQFWGLAVFEGKVLEGGLHCRLQMRDLKKRGRAGELRLRRRGG